MRAASYPLPLCLPSSFIKIGWQSIFKGGPLLRGCRRAEGLCWHHRVGGTVHVLTSAVLRCRWGSHLSRTQLCSLPLSVVKDLTLERESYIQVMISYLAM